MGRNKKYIDHFIISFLAKEKREIKETKYRNAFDDVSRERTRKFFSFTNH